jgi:transposase
LIPVKSGDRVKTNRRDAEKLARLYRSGELHFEHAAQEATFLDYLHELEHASERIARLERALERAIETAPGEMRALIDGVQALRGVSSLTAATIVAEVGPPSRFARPKQLMGYSCSASTEDWWLRASPIRKQSSPWVASCSASSGRLACR